MSQSIFTGRSRMAAVLAIGLTAAAMSAPSGAKAAEPGADEVWQGLVTDVFEGKPMQDGTGIVSLEAPARAADPALVPVTLSVDPTRHIRKLTLVIDHNPAPVAASFTLGDGAGVTRIETRVRVNAYTDIHLVGEADDGTLYVTSRYVKAAGGCAAPASKDPAAAARSIGQMKLRRFGAAEGSGGTRDEAQLMIRHPNNSGLQKDQVTLLYIPAHFITELTVARGERTLFTMEGGISISEDPSFRFDYRADTPEPFHVKAVDTENMTFAHDFPADAS
ncbi:quinoprotein dehydrogenase-associated SoxYZ-like carrier [Mangrovibrevibacter kandeliae]|uniref:quinoprotein dehydrogenase-associated SoxYZ-like carrier n=1 Tax=Mangrovibrevibacter kandeliae TaxID=2968473 RepID=UPI002118CCA6|nr:quinoprotein dehydrogenase-associated SoxYZ-like carrier [Aurantimonas sp. CSK15Z-1]MCQ8783140.1 quinoprotein dehydrogenase-associated SoxYZ-like carrier [Aurantimonas sp. CSK15Z-1]